MECIKVNEYICKKCGYITNTKPACFPICPACEVKTTGYSNNTKGEDRKTI